MGTQNQTFTAKELPLLSCFISLWSSRGFQNFWRSGVFHDMVEVVKKNKPGVISFDSGSRNMLRFSYNPGEVTRGQIIEILQLIPDGCWESFRVSFGLWSQTSGWWDGNPSVNWHFRDEWREEMGLERINPVRLLGPHGKLLVFRRTGHSGPLKLPDGYKYASLEDLKRVETPAGESIPIVVNLQGIWGFNSGQRLVKIPSPEQFFHDYVVFVPLVEL